jgi:hypothetical protein
MEKPLIFLVVYAASGNPATGLPRAGKDASEAALGAGEDSCFSNLDFINGIKSPSIELANQGQHIV